MELFKTVFIHSHIHGYLFIFESKILKFTKYSIKLIEKLSRRHLINSSDVFVIKGFTVHSLSDKSTKGTIVNRTCHAVNEESPKSPINK